MLAQHKHTKRKHSLPTYFLSVFSLIRMHTYYLCKQWNVLVDTTLVAYIYEIYSIKLPRHCTKDKTGISYTIYLNKTQQSIDVLFHLTFALLGLSNNEKIVSLENDAVVLYRIHLFVLFFSSVKSTSSFSYHFFLFHQNTDYW